MVYVCVITFPAPHKPSLSLVDGRREEITCNFYLHIFSQAKATKDDDPCGIQSPSMTATSSLYAHYWEV